MTDLALPGGLQLPELAGTQALAFVLVLARVGPLFLLAPALSSGFVPQRARFVVAAAFSLALTPIAGHGRVLPQAPVDLGLAFSQEVGVGLAFALALGALAAAVSAGASLLDTLVGFSFGALVDPITGNNGAVLGRIYSMFAAMVFVLGGGVQLMVLGLARSYELVPLGSFPPPAALGQLALASLTQVPLMGLELAAPVILSVVVVDAAFGLVARAVPQMNVFVVGLPVKVLVAFALVGTSLPFVATHLTDSLQQSILQALRALGAH